MSKQDLQDPLDVLLQQCRDWVDNDKYTPQERKRLLSFNAGACWGIAMETDRPDRAMKGFRLREEIAVLQGQISEKDDK